MKAHLSEGMLQQLLDGEMSDGDREAAEAHLAGCAPCRAELQTLRNAFAVVTRGISLVHPPPASLEIAHAAWRRRLRGGWASHLRIHLPRAALFVLAVAGVASATLPGSPLRAWIASAWEQEPSGGAGTGLVGTDDDVLPPAPATASAGVSIDPADGEVRILVERSSPELRIRVRLADVARMSVRGTAGAAEARFRMARGRVHVEGAGAGELEVVIPLTAERATISVGGRRVLFKQGAELHVLVPADSVGTEIVFPAGS